MFKELMPVIADRPCTITVASLPEGKIRVCVIPQSQDKDGKVNEKVGYQAEKEVAKIPESAINALTAPVALTGTPEELDAEIPAHLAAYAGVHEQLQHSVEQATQQITEAVKAISEREKTRARTKSASTATNDNAKTQRKEEQKPTPEPPDQTLPLAWCTPVTQDTVAPSTTDTPVNSKEN